MTTHKMFQNELAEILARGAAFMQELVQDSLSNDEMPPKPVLEWYAMFVVYRFVSVEFDVAHGETDKEEDMVNFAREVQYFLGLSSRNKLFALQAEIEKVLQTRKLHLPPGYTPVIG